jgi:predicted negative regulator of RcsB-dependent stress response
VRSYTRHQLKQDAFRAQTTETISWAVENQSKLIAAGVALAVIVAVVLGGWWYVDYRNQQAQSELSGAIEKLNAPIRAAGQPPVPGELSFASAEERAKAANAEFTRIADKYGFTPSGRIARYFAGITAHDMGHDTDAEKALQMVGGSRDKEIASLAKMALAGIYHDTGRDPQAIALYKDLADHPSASVGKTAAEFQLAALYEESHQPDQARALYQQMQKESPASPVAQLAAQKLRALGQP